VSTLTLVRHGQAQIFQQPAAALSPLGEAQAAKLADFWATNRTRFDEVHSGSLARQVRTEAVLAEFFQRCRQPWPAAVRDPAWNEYDATGVLAHLPREDSRIALLEEEYERARGTPEENRRFQRMLEAAMLRWLDGSLTAAGVEPWPSFRQRVSGALERIMSGPPGRRVAVFTSGGPIGFAVHCALRAPARSFLDVNWRIRNCSVTEFVFDRDRLTLDSFNCIPHLDDPSLRTYR
jgi:broad specificity phosphatase PhoE